MDLVQFLTALFYVKIYKLDQIDHTCGDLPGVKIDNIDIWPFFSNRYYRINVFRTDDLRLKIFYRLVPGWAKKPEQGKSLPPASAIIIL